MLWLTPGAQWVLPLPPSPYPYALLVAHAASGCATHAVVLPAQACAGRLRLHPAGWALPPGTYSLDVWGQASPTNHNPALAGSLWFARRSLWVPPAPCPHP
jgi:hypothetical protein